MAQRFPVPNTGNNGPPPQRYPPSSVPPNLRQYSGPNFPMQQRSGFTPPPQMSNAAPGPGGIMRPNQPYTNMRQGPMPTPPVGKRSADQRIPLSQQKPYVTHIIFNIDSLIYFLQTILLYNSVYMCMYVCVRARAGVYVMCVYIAHSFIHT